LAGGELDAKAMNLRFKDLLEMWRKDEEYYEAQENAGVFFLPGGGAGYSYSDLSGYGLDMGGAAMNMDPATREELLKILRMEQMLSGDYQKMRELILNNNMDLLRKNKELLNQNNDILAKCSKSDEEEKYKLILKENQRFKMELDL